jgi:hypothetical protein
MAKIAERTSKEFLAAQSTIGVANTLGAQIPSTVPAMGAKICSAVCAKLSGLWSWCFCSSLLLTWVVGGLAFLVIGEIVLRVLA